MPIYNRKSQKVPRILVVDDVATNRLMVEVILKGEGVEIVTAANGMEALAAAEVCTIYIVILLSKKRISLAIFISAVAVVLRAPEKLTSSSLQASEKNLFLLE